MGDLTNNKKRRSYPKPLVINGIRFFWICLIIWLELGVFYWSLHSCNWPDNDIKTTRRPTPTHVMLIADPQVIDHRSYPGRRLWLKTLTQFIVDSNLRKSWRAAKGLHPDVVVFLGDMMDGGRYRMLDDEYEGYYARFNDIFSTRKDIPKYYLVGNHDVGLGKSNAFSARARQRYLSHFGGSTNYQIPIANHSFVFIDAPGLVEEDYRRYEEEESFEDWAGTPGGTFEFINRLSQESNPKPRILFSHVPLSRSAAASCGPLRERGSIQRGAGMGYQNLLGRHTSQFLLDNIKPIMIFSGDDHDYCEIRHARSEGGLGPREVSVKSFSMAMGIRRPGFQLLSLVSPDPSSPYARTIADTPCHLPDQMHIYTHVYAICGFLSVALLMYLNSARSRDQPSRDHGPSIFKSPQRPKERPVLRSSSLNVPSPRILRSRSGSPLGSPIIPSSPILLPIPGDPDSDHDISYPPSPTAAPPTPGSYFDLAGEEHSFNLPAPAIQQRTRSSGWVEARHQSRWSSLVASAKNLTELLGCGCRSRKDAGFARRLAGDFWACAWPPLSVLAFIWITLFW